MIEAFVDVFEQIPRGLVYVVMGVVVLAIARIAQDIITPYKIQEQLNQKDNVALAVSISGYYFGVILVFLGGLYHPFLVVADNTLGFTAAYWQEVGLVFVYSIVGIIVLNVARILVDKLVLHDFSTEEEIIRDHNAGTGAVEFAVYVAVGLVIAGAISGESGGPETAVAFLLLGLVALIIYTLVYEWTTSFNIHEQIEADNVAVGVALAGNLIAIGIVVFKAVFGEFVGWTESIAGFVTYAVLGFVLLYIVRFVVDKVLFPHVRLSDELAVDRNLGAAFIESAALICVSLILFFAI
jgi:uncharacterized membrane protein YjfL (UPF0719 family)